MKTEIISGEMKTEVLSSANKTEKKTTTTSFDDIKQKMDLLTSLQQTSSLLSRSLVYEEVLSFSVQGFAGLVRAEGAFLAMANGDHRSLAIKSKYGLIEGIKAKRIQLNNNPIGRSFKMGVSLSVDCANDKSEEALLSDVFRKESVMKKIQSVLIVPLKIEGKPFGVMVAVKKSPKEPFSRDASFLASAFANQASIAISNADLFRQVNQKKEQINIMNIINCALNRVQTLEEFLDLLAAYVQTLLGTNIWSIMLYRPEDQKLELLHMQALPQKYAREYPFPEKYSRKGFSAGVSANDLSLPPLEHNVFLGQPLLPKIGFKYSLSLNLVAHGRLFGLLNFHYKNKPSFSREKRQMLFSLAEYSATALDKHLLISELRTRKEVQAELIKKIINAQEEERKRLALNLHDDLLQNIIAVLFQLESASLNDQGLLVERAERAKQILRESIISARCLIYDLRPPMLDDLGLAPALKKYTEDFERDTGIKTILSSPSKINILPHAETVVFRIIQEALNNVKKHAQASSVEVKLEVPGKKIVATVKDNGIGLNLDILKERLPSGQNIGLQAIKERVELTGGQVNIRSAQGKGTELFFTIPIGEGETNGKD